MKKNIIPGNIVVYDHRACDGDWYLLDLVIGYIPQTKKVLTFVWETADWPSNSNYYKIQITSKRAINRDCTCIIQIS